MGRSPCCDKEGLKKGPWTPEEDQKLVDYVKKHGPGNWRTLPKNAGLKRCGKSCRLRWTNYLRPDIKRGRFSFEEEETIIQLHSILGNKWSAIASRLPGRTDNEIKNYWNTSIRKRLLKMGIDPVTHNPRLDLLELSSILNSTLYRSSQKNMSSCVGTRPLINSELLKLAASLVSSQHKNQNHNQYQNRNQNQNQSFSVHNAQEDRFHMLVQQDNLQNPIQEIQPCTTLDSACATFFNEAQVMEPDVNQFVSNLTDFCDEIPQLNGWHGSNLPLQVTEDYAHLPSSYDYNCYGMGQTITNLFSDHQTNQNLSFSSVLSTPSLSPASLNSNSTYMNSSHCSTEDEGEIYSSEVMKFGVPDIVDFNRFI